METLQAYLIDAGWIFFGAWAVALLLLLILAFARDLRPAAKHHENKLPSR